MNRPQDTPEDWARIASICRRLGWYCYWDPTDPMSRHGRVRCSAERPGAMPDTERWSASSQPWTEAEIVTAEREGS